MPSCRVLKNTLPRIGCGIASVSRDYFRTCVRLGLFASDWSNAIYKFIFNATKALAMYQADTLDIILTHLIKAVQECRDLISSQPDAWHKKVESIAVSSLPRTDFLCDTTMLNPHTHALRRIGQLQLLSASWCAWLIA